MKVLNLIQCLNLGGMEQSSYLLMKETQGQTIDWLVQSITPAGLGEQIASGFNIPVADSPYKGKFGYRSHFSLKRKIDDFSGDLILMTGPTLTGCSILKSNPHKKVLGIHFCHQSGALNLLKWKTFYAVFGDDYDAIAYYSPFSLKEAKEIAPQLQHKFHLVEYSVERCSATTEFERQSARESLGIQANAFVVGNAGWLIERKRFDVFLQICAQLHASTSNQLLFLIAGDGSLRNDLEALANKLGIAEKTRFLGWQKNLDVFYKSLDLLLFNSNSDAFGLTVLEAMGYGIPVVASVLEGGADTFLIHQENGYLLQEHRINQLAEYCLNMMQDKELYEKFRSRSLELVSDRFSTKKYVQRHLDIFHQVLSS
jgi:L-malate glycosyltransferase